MQLIDTPKINYDLGLPEVLLEVCKCIPEKDVAMMVNAFWNLDTSTPRVKSWIPPGLTSDGVLLPLDGYVYAGAVVTEERNLLIKGIFCQEVYYIQYFQESEYRSKVHNIDRYLQGIQGRIGVIRQYATIGTPLFGEAWTQYGLVLWATEQYMHAVV